MTQSISRVHSCAAIANGDKIQAEFQGVVHFRGQVAEMHPTMSIFWAVDSIGERRLIDFLDFAVYLVHDADTPHWLPALGA